MYQNLFRLHQIAVDPIELLILKVYMILKEDKEVRCYRRHRTSIKGEFTIPKSVFHLLIIFHKLKIVIFLEVQILTTSLSVSRTLKSPWRQSVSFTIMMISAEATAR